MKNYLIMVFCAFFVSACATPVLYELDSGSMTTGEVIMSYTHEAYQVPIPNKQQALKQALKRCLDWGFKSVVDASEDTTHCSDSVVTICKQYTVKKTYQCQY